MKIRELVSNNVLVLSPRFTEQESRRNVCSIFWRRRTISIVLERHHLDSIDNADALIVCDPEGYVGASALIEVVMQMWVKNNFAQKPEEFMLNTLPAEVGL